MGLSLGAALLLGAILAPTDPVLAGDIGVGPPGDEDEHEPNFALTAEAGVNDGLAFPFVLARAVRGRAGRQRLDRRVAARRRRSTPSRGRRGDRRRGRARAAAWSVHGCATASCSRPPSTAGSRSPTALVIYGLTEVAGGYGFLAVFVGGLAFRRYERDHELNGRVHEGAEQVEKFGSWR